MAVGFQVTFDAADPGRLAEFWAVTLDYQVQPLPHGFDSWEAFAKSVGIPESEWDSMSAVVDPSRAGRRVLFQRVPEGKAVQNRTHLDVHASKEHGHTGPG